MADIAGIVTAVGSVVALGAGVSLAPQADSRTVAAATPAMIEQRIINLSSIMLPPGWSLLVEDYRYLPQLPTPRLYLLQVNRQLRVL